MSTRPLDVYRDWLGITETVRPLNYYQLLRLKLFEDDTAKVRGNYRKMNAHVRKFSTGEFGRQSQELLNELAKAMLCLTDVQRKREYDATLGRKSAAEGRRHTLEEILLASKVIDQAQLAKARSYAQAVGLEVRDALVQQKLAPAETVMMAYAESIGLPYMELEDVGVDEELAPQIPPAMARQHSCVPLMIDQERLLMASPTPLVPDVEEELRLRFNMPVRTVLCRAASINAAVAKYYPRDAVLMVPSKGAAKGAKPAKSAKAPAKSEDAEAEAAPAPERKYLSADEKIRRWGMIGVLGFGITVMVMMVVMSFIRGGMHLLGRWDFPIVLLAATVVGGIAVGVDYMMKR